MATEDEDLELFPAYLPLDRATIAWLARLERLTGTHPNVMIASMLRDIRADDEAANAANTRH